MKKSFFLLLLCILSCSSILATVKVKVGQTETMYCTASAPAGYIDHAFFYLDDNNDADYLSITYTSSDLKATIRGLKPKANIRIKVVFTYTYTTITGKRGIGEGNYYDYVTVEAGQKPTSISISPNPLKINHVGGDVTEISVVTVPSDAYTTYTWEVDNSKGNPKAAHLIYTNGKTNKVRADQTGTTYIKVTTAEGLTAEGSITISTLIGHYYGKDGNISWDLLDGTLKLTGTGSMKDYDSTGNGGRVGKAPWLAYSDQIINIDISSGITNIGSLAFATCSNFENNTIPSTVTQIGGSAFEGCKSVKKIDLPSKLTSIGGMAFYGCENLETIKIPESVTYIGGSAFYDCYSLRQINIPKAISVLMTNTFFGCHKLEFIDLPENLTEIQDQALFACHSLKSVFIPDRVSVIGLMAIASCRNLESIRIPKSVTKIGNNGFNGVAGNDKMRNIIVNWSNPVSTVSKFFLSTTYKNATLWVPRGTMSKYKGDAEWGKFVNVMEFDDEPLYLLNSGSPTGDLNSDGSVNGTDIVLLTNMILGKTSKTSAGDVNGDGEVNGTDIVKLVNMILNK